MSSDIVRQTGFFDTAVTNPLLPWVSISGGEGTYLACQHLKKLTLALCSWKTHSVSSESLDWLSVSCFVCDEFLP